MTVFVGNTAAISFLKFLQKTLERYLGPSGFTDDQESHRLFEADTTGIISSRFYDGLSLGDRKAFVHCFLDAVSFVIAYRQRTKRLMSCQSSGLLDLFSWDDVSLMLEIHHVSTPDTGLSASQQLNSLDVACLYLMVAIGAQCCGLGPHDISCADELFLCARKLALEKMLENPSLELVRAFILMSFYMLGACRRNSAFMYLGVASKAADILGLHACTQCKHLPPVAQIARSVSPSWNLIAYRMVIMLKQNC